MIRTSNLGTFLATMAMAVMMLVFALIVLGPAFTKVERPPDITIRIAGTKLPSPTLGSRGYRLPKGLEPHPHATLKHKTDTMEVYNRFLRGKCPQGEHLRCGRDKYGVKVMFACLDGDFIGGIIVYLEGYAYKGLKWIAGPIIGTGYQTGEYSDTWGEGIESSDTDVWIDEEGELQFLDESSSRQWHHCIGPEWKGVREWLTN